jgi:hypothetical protein
VCYSVLLFVLFSSSSKHTSLESPALQNCLAIAAFACVIGKEFDSEWKVEDRYGEEQSIKSVCYFLAIVNQHSKQMNMDA